MLALAFVVYLVLGLLPVCGVSYVIYFLLTLPMRRNERARMFLDLLELGLQEGRTPEAAITGAAASRDRSLGVRFHLLAAHHRRGVAPQPGAGTSAPAPPRASPRHAQHRRAHRRYPEGPARLPPAAAGQRLPVRGALNYLILLAFAVTPAMVVVPIYLRIYVLPKFKEVFAGMLEGQSCRRSPVWSSGEAPYHWPFSSGIVGIIWLATLAYVGGPRLHGWLHRAFPGAQDWLLFRLPWRRKRLQRDFSAMLAVLLDAEVPETEAVSLAAQSTANLAIIRRAQKVCALLQEGVKLPEALRALDNSRELQWRLSNALRRGAGLFAP